MRGSFDANAKPRAVAITQMKSLCVLFSPSVMHAPSVDAVHKCSAMRWGTDYWRYVGFLRVIHQNVIALRHSPNVNTIMRVQTR
jgi:hypothetical protein